MPFDEALAGRVREVLAPRGDVDERRMFGGIAFMVAGYMATGVVGDELMLRLGPERTALALERPSMRPMDFTGRVMRGYVLADPAVLDDAALADLVDETIDFVLSLPPRP